MKKTTIYLPDEMKAKLEQASAETSRSEADLIREGIQAVLSQKEPPAPHTGIFDSGDPDFASRVDELLEGFGSH